MLGAAEVAGQGGGGVPGVGDEQPGAADRAGGVGAVVAAEPPGGQGGGEPPADLGQQLRQAGRGERQLADELVGVGGLGEAPAAEGGVVQGADRPGRGAGQGQGLVGESVTASPSALPPSPVLPFLRFLRAADEELVGDLLAQGLVVAVAQGGQVVDPGRAGSVRACPSGVRVLGWRCRPMTNGTAVPAGFPPRRTSIRSRSNGENSSSTIRPASHASTW